MAGLAVTLVDLQLPMVVVVQVGWEAQELMAQQAHLLLAGKVVVVVQVRR
jgi:hypothetical protein